MASPKQPGKDWNMHRFCFKQINMKTPIIPVNDQSICLMGVRVPKHSRAYPTIPSCLLKGKIIP